MLSSCLAFAFLFPVPLASPTVVSFAPANHVRAVHPDVCLALGAAYADSPTVQRLVHELETSDLIVHLEKQPAGATPSGLMRFVTAATGARFARISLDVMLPKRRLAALIGHELQHAVEVARARWVDDQASFEALYRRLGHATGAGDTHYDTLEAQRVGMRVLAEVTEAARAATARASRGDSRRLGRAGAALPTRRYTAAEV